MKYNEKEFIKQYSDHSIPLRKIRKQFGLEYNTFYKIRTQLIQEGKITPRPFQAPRKQKHQVKNYSYCNLSKNFQIRKNGKYYGCVKTEKQAKKMIELFEKNNWDITLKNEIKKQVMENT